MSEPNKSSSFSTRRRWPSRLTFWIAGIIIVLTCIRLALPFAIKSYANHQLNKSRDYRGSIGDVTLHIWRGAYQIHDIKIFKTGGQVSTPLFSTRAMDLSLEWSELFHGALVSKIIMLKPKVNFVAGPTKEQSQSGKENNWGDTLESLVPFKINRLQIKNGQLHFQNPYAKPPVDIYLNELACTATNFTNARDLKQKLPAGISARAKTLGAGELILDLKLNPMAKTPTFELNGQLTNVDLVSLNDFLRAYGKFDVARGQFALFTSFAGQDGKYDGYCKVFFKNLDVFEWQKDHTKNALEIFWEAVVGTVTTAFKNQPKDQLATKIPISGSFEKTDVHILPTIETLLRNAFIHSLALKMDQPVNLDQVQK
jgi:hypothetical protein